MGLNYQILLVKTFILNIWVNILFCLKSDLTRVAGKKKTVSNWLGEIAENGFHFLRFHNQVHSVYGLFKVSQIGT